MLPGWAAAPSPSRCAWPAPPGSARRCRCACERITQSSSATAPRQGNSSLIRRPDSPWRVNRNGEPRSGLEPVSSGRSPNDGTGLPWSRFSLGLAVERVDVREPAGQEEDDQMLGPRPGDRSAAGDSRPPAVHLGGLDQPGIPTDPGADGSLPRPTSRSHADRMTSCPPRLPISIAPATRSRIRHHRSVSTSWGLVQSR